MDTRPNDIAIIGSGCRFAGDSTSPSKFWEALRDPKLFASEVPALKGYYHKDAQYHGHANVKEAYLLEGEGVHRRFDAAFFGISPSEANLLDPQIRLLLEVIYESLEAGGQTIHQLRGSDTAVYAGQMVNDYELQMYRDHENFGKYHATGTSRAMLSNRVSYFFDWHGPSMTIDTACSSSLVALHHAVQQLRSGGSRVAVVAGSNLIYDAGTFIAETNLQMLSPDGRSRMWDADANGYARGEGVAAIVLKTRAAAEADGDHIECIIRETAVNQDGRTRGQTMPSATAQAQLIRDCYARAGLDLKNPAHRPQFFEAHGTGTPAGDPVEAEAISSALFPEGGAGLDGSLGPLLVGSCKTVIGHTEGTAGIASILKASLAIQNATVPPNLLFNRLNPEVRPFYNHLCIPTGTPRPWPAITGEGPRRVSVNGFGFGGTNVHAIVEEYVAPPTRALQLDQPSLPTFIPFVFSAASESSLRKVLENFLGYLRRKDIVHSLRDISYSLEARRTRFPVAIAVSAATTDELVDKIGRVLESAQNNPEQRVGVRTARQDTGTGSNEEKARVLGVFTGQGAQWAQMGLDLITTSPASRRLMETLQEALDQLPAGDRPTWSLLQELHKDASSTRVMSAALSQPLCTAIQIAQVDLIRAAGVELSAVVGHSSGEIAAAYAAGLISAQDAICIAYYRGLHSGLSQGSQMQRGAMMAVGTSAEDAQELLDFDEFQGRACIAAVNSKQSVTLSGDQDAIEELAVVFEDEEKFVRVLKVDKAYHSHHMAPCSTKYLESLKALDIQIGGGNKVRWFSSVSASEMGKDEMLKGLYWDNNMVKPVLFMQAVDEACLAMKSLDLVIELGPHPALKGPTLETIRDRLSSAVPYTGLFQRGVSGITSFADGLGFAWTHLGLGAVDLQRFDQFVCGPSSVAPKPVKGLPPYAWDHRNEYWHESRQARTMRLRQDPVHELLGHLTPDSTEHDMRWRHVLRPSEVPWLAGHRLQNGMVFPAAGYVVSVLEAAVALARDAPAKLIELFDIDIVSALMFENDKSSMETLLSLTNVSRHNNDLIEAEFKYHAASAEGTDELRLKATGRVRVHLGGPDEAVLPPRIARPSNLTPVRKEKFYDSIAEIGYQYGGPFKSLEGIERKLGAATGSISKLESSTLLIHPAVLDAAFHSTFITYAAPGDGSLGSMHVPKRIRHLTINPDLCTRERATEAALAFDSFHSKALPHVNLICDVNIYTGSSDQGMVQIQGLECVPFSPPTVQDDKSPFCHLVWDVAEPDIQLVLEDHQLAALLQRTASFYLRVLEREIPISHPSREDQRYKELFKRKSLLATGDTSSYQPQWEEDTLESLAVAQEPFRNSAELKILSSLGESLVDIVKSDPAALSPVIELSRDENRYTSGTGEETFATHLARTVKQIVHRYPHMHILELGSEIGSLSNTIIDEIGSKFSSYTVATHPAALTSADDKLAGGKQTGQKVILKDFNPSQGLEQQGFVEASYNLVVAPQSLAASPDLEQALRNVRRLLKPGGYLVVLERLPSNINPFNSLVQAFPECWPSAWKSEAPAGPACLANWAVLLRETGFSGIDTSIGDGNSTSPFSVFATQAVDDKIAFLRDPLSVVLPSSERLVQDLVILGGRKRSKTAVLASQISTALRPFCDNVRVTDSCAEFLGVDITPSTVLLSIADLDESMFGDLTDEKWATLKRMVLHAGTFVCVTQGRLSQDPHANMMLGLLRGAARDNPALDSLLLDFEDARGIDHGTVIAEALLRHRAASRWRHRDGLQLTVENELVVDNTGRILIPRLMVSQEMSDRYNSNGREIRTLVRPGMNDVGVSTTHDAKWDLNLQQPLSPQPQQKSTTITIETTHSLLSPVRVAEFGFMFLVLGRDKVSGDRYVALASKNNSSVEVLRRLSVPVETQDSVSDGRLLWLTAHSLLANFALRSLSEDDRVLVHEPSSEFARAITEQARLLGVQAKYTTTSSEPSGYRNPEWTVIHPTVSDSTLEYLAREEPSVFIDLNPRTKVRSIGQRIGAALPVHCRKENLDSLFGGQAFSPKASHERDIQSLLEMAVSWASTMLGQSGETKCPIRENIPTIPLASITGVDGHSDPFTVIEWDPSSTVAVKACPVDSLVSFPNNRTYWLVGLTGGLGLSLCEWMAQRGARYFVISSRNPDVEAAWLDEIRGKGATIKVSACDVTQREQIEALHHEISSSMPPIAGVAQGVMVLEDKALQDMTLEQLLAVTKPKVDGSIYLNDLFLETPLDFFIFFSSVSTVVGNHGQANYAAANSFMTSLAEQRRRRGLAASVIDIGPIAGIGYISRAFQDASLSSITMRTSGFASTSERDFHQLFGEAVLAGRPGATGPIELVSGLRRVGAQEEHQPVWYSWPRMSHLIKSHEAAIDPTSNNSEGQIPVKVRLAKAVDSEIYDIIWDSFAGQLSSHFQLDTRDASKAELAAMRFDQMGIDSLTAVEIRGWFVKTLEVNIPVLKILNGGSIGDLVATATETIRSRRVPVTDDGSEASATSQEMVDSSNEDHTDGPGDSDEENMASKTSSVRNFDTNEYSPPVILKSVPVSFTQARFYPSGLFLEDRVGLNHTAWAKISGAIDLERLRKAVRAIGQQHEILRTAFFDQDGEQMQHILEDSLLHLEHDQIQSEEDVTAIAMSIQKTHVYDVARGETMRVLFLSRAADENYLVMGVHPLIMDATGIQVFLRWLAFHYTHPQAPRRVKQFAAASEQRRAAYAAGAFAADLRHWRQEFPRGRPPPPMPLLTLARVAERPALRAYENITATCRIGVETKALIGGICRRLRTTPFHFYLAALRALLLRYSVGGEDVTTAVAESGRGRDAEEMEVIGPLYNLVLVRLVADLSTRFEDLLVAARDKTYAGLENSNFPFPKLVEELGLQQSAKYTPFFQVFADYRTGQRETVAFGEDNELILMGFDLNVPYDVYLDTIDEPEGDCAHCLFLRKDLFAQPEAEVLAASYKLLIEAFAAEPGLSVEAAELSRPVE